MSSNQRMENYLNPKTLNGTLRALKVCLTYPKLLLLRLRYGVIDCESYAILMRLRKQGYIFDQIIDVGAHAGEFALAALLAFPECEKITSFEPQPDVAEKCKNKLLPFPAAKVERTALGSEVCKKTFYISSFTPDSSFFKTTEERLGDDRLKALEVPVKPLDDFGFHSSDAKCTLLKLDCQGFEMEVLKGSQKTLKNVDVILVEILFAPVYAGQCSFHQIYDTLINMGFYFGGPYCTMLDQTLHGVQQIDAVFFKRKPNQTL